MTDPIVGYVSNPGLLVRSKTYWCVACARPRVKKEINAITASSVEAQQTCDTCKRVLIEAKGAV